MRTQYRLGIDAGGTFTDFVLADRVAGTVSLYKTLSTPGDPTEAIKGGLRLISEDLGVTEKDVISNCDFCINGTTVGLNAPIRHKERGRAGCRVRGVNAEGDGALKKKTMKSN